jgi:diguanylate cyclase (GGDEF)-like protein
VSQHPFDGFDDKKISVSIGIASLPDPSIDSQDKLITKADLALYEAKKKGRNRMEIV